MQSVAAYLYTTTKKDQKKVSLPCSLGLLTPGAICCSLPGGAVADRCGAVPDEVGPAGPAVPGALHGADHRHHGRLDRGARGHVART